MKYCDFTTKEFKQRCRSAPAAKTVRVRYNDREEDVFYLCAKCASAMADEARGKGWQIAERDYKN